LDAKAAPQGVVIASDFADIVVYVNGLPLAVIECKSPALADPMGEAIRQFRRYQGRDEFSGLGAPRLFETAQMSIALARDVAKYGTTLVSFGT
jgi:type I restriction enzyme, R subunit